MDEETKAILKQLAEAQAMHKPNNAITFEGINKYWPQIVAIVALGYFLMGQAKEQERLMGRVSSVEAAVQSVNQVKEEQAKNISDMKLLQADMNAVKSAQKDQAEQMAKILSAVNVLSQQVQSWSGSIMKQRQ